VSTDSLLSGSDDVVAEEEEEEDEEEEDDVTVPSSSSPRLNCAKRHTKKALGPPFQRMRNDGDQFCQISETAFCFSALAA
jgi:hypothetical protein